MHCLLAKVLKNSIFFPPPFSNSMASAGSSSEAAAAATPGATGGGSRPADLDLEKRAFTALEALSLAQLEQEWRELDATISEMLGTHQLAVESRALLVTNLLAAWSRTQANPRGSVHDRPQLVAGLEASAFEPEIVSSLHPCVRLALARHFRHRLVALSSPGVEWPGPCGQLDLTVEAGFACIAVYAVAMDGDTWGESPRGGRRAVLASGMELIRSILHNQLRLPASAAPAARLAFHGDIVARLHILVRTAKEISFFFSLSLFFFFAGVCGGHANRKQRCLQVAFHFA